MSNLVRRSRRHLVPAALLGAVVVASAGTGAVADQLVGSRDLANNSLRSVDVKNETLKSRDIKNDTVRGTDVRDGSLSAADFNGALGSQPPTMGLLSASDEEVLVGEQGFVKIDCFEQGYLTSGSYFSNGLTVLDAVYEDITGEGYVDRYYVRVLNETEETQRLDITAFCGTVALPD